MYFVFRIMYFSRDGGEEALLMQFVFRILYFSRDGGEEALLMQFVFRILDYVFQQRWGRGGVTDAVCISHFGLCISAEMAGRRRY